jgi:hypothetical protein
VVFLILKKTSLPSVATILIFKVLSGGDSQPGVRASIEEEEEEEL